MFPPISTLGASAVLTSPRPTKKTDRPGLAADRSLAQHFPDLEMQLHDPAPARVAHDQFAVDTRLRFRPQDICGQLMSEQAPPPCSYCTAQVRDDQCRQRLASTLGSAYEFSPTFRRLFNQAWDTNLYHPDRRCFISMEDTSPTMYAMPPAPGDDRRIRLMRLADANVCGTATYTSAQGDEPLDWFRACLGEVIRLLTGFRDDDRQDHPRGGVIEYTNSVLKEMGHQGPACFHRDLPASAPALAGDATASDHQVQNQIHRPIPVLSTKPVAGTNDSGAARNEVMLLMQQTSHPSPKLACVPGKRVPEWSSQAVRQMHAHLRMCEDYLDLELQPDVEVLKRDATSMIEVVRLENVRKPDLHLTLCKSVSDAITVLQNAPSPSRQRLIFRDVPIGPHYAFADINIRPNMPASMILFESACLGGVGTNALYKKFAQGVEKLSQFSTAQMSIIDVDVQRSPSDCLIFCLSFALKAHRHAALLTQWHTAQHHDFPFATPVRNGEAAFYARLGFNLYPESVLPMDFIKHTHSREVIGRRLDTLPAEEDVPTRSLLVQKMMSAQRRFTPKGYRYYLPSIEYKRRDLLTRTLNNLVAEDSQRHSGLLISRSPANTDTAD